MMDKNRMVEIAQGIAAMQRIADEYGLRIEANEISAVSLFEVWADDCLDIVSVVDTVATTFEGDI